MWNLSPKGAKSGFKLKLIVKNLPNEQFTSFNNGAFKRSLCDDSRERLIVLDEVYLDTEVFMVVEFYSGDSFEMAGHSVMTHGKGLHGCCWGLLGKHSSKAVVVLQK